MADITEHTIIFDPCRRVDQSAWIEHIPFAFYLVSALKPKVLVELGVDRGTSFNAFCQAVKTLQTDTKCYGVDTWKGDGHTGRYDETVYEELAAYQQDEYKGFSHLLRMTFDGALQYFSDGSLDVLHIDGFHTYEAVRHDFESWLPKLSDRGVVLLHDTLVRDRNFGVWKFWEEISSLYPSFEFKHGHGLGVVIVGKHTEKQFLSFIAAAKENSFYQNLFFSLGNRIKLLQLSNNAEDQLGEKSRQIELKETELQAGKRELRAMHEQVQILGEQMMRKESEIRALLNSWSWRITEPLRWMHARLSRSGQQAGNDRREMAEFRADIRYSALLRGKPPEVSGEPAVSARPFHEVDSPGVHVAAEQGVIDIRRDGRIAVLAVVTTQQSSGEPDACALIRLALPLRHPGLARRITLRIVPQNQVFRYQADLVVVQRTAVSDLRVARMLIAHCRRAGMKLVYETDDDLFSLPVSHPERDHYKQLAAPAGLLLAEADAVTVSTPCLKRRFIERNDNIRVIPNALDERLWGLTEGGAPRETEARVVGILYMGTMTHAEDLVIVKSALQRLQDEYGERIRFDVIGIVPGGEAWFNRISIPSHIPGNYIEFVKWLCAQRPWHIGIAPLADTDFNRCKSHIKCLDYAALGLASVFSDLDPYRGTVQQGITGLLVPNTDEDWYQGLKRLIDDPVMRHRMRESAYADLLAKHTLAAQTRTRETDWNEILALTVDRPQPDPADIGMLEKLREAEGDVDEALGRILGGA